MKLRQTCSIFFMVDEFKVCLLECVWSLRFRFRFVTIRLFYFVELASTFWMAWFWPINRVCLLTIPYTSYPTDRCSFSFNKLTISQVFCNVFRVESSRNSFCLFFFCGTKTHENCACYPKESTGIFSFSTMKNPPSLS